MSSCGIAAGARVVFDSSRRTWPPGACPSPSWPRVASGPATRSRSWRSDRRTAATFLYGNVDEARAQSIVDGHLAGGTPVADLLDPRGLSLPGKAEADRAGKLRRHRSRVHRPVHRARRVRRAEKGADRHDPGRGHRGGEALGPARTGRRGVLHGDEVDLRAGREVRSRGRSTSSATPTRATRARSWTARCWRETRTRCWRAC